MLDSIFVVSDKAESSILGVVPLAEANVSLPVETPELASTDTLGLAPIDEDDDDAPVQLRPVPKPSVERPRAEPPLPPPRPPRKPSGDDLLAPPEDRGTEISGIGAVEAASDNCATSAIPRLGGKKGKREKTKRPAKRRGKEQWDSPLLVLGGGALAVLLVAGVVLWYLLFRESADKVLTQADEYFDKGSYAQAIEQYAHFVEKFPGHQDYSRAKVRLNLAKVWQAVDSPGDPAIGLTQVKEAIDQIEDEQAFISDGQENKEGLSEAKRELSALLTRIAKGIADKAEAAKDGADAQERIKQLEMALALCDNNKYVPEQFRNAAELTAARETLDRVEKRQRARRRPGGGPDQDGRSHRPRRHRGRLRRANRAARAISLCWRATSRSTLRSARLPWRPKAWSSTSPKRNPRPPTSRTRRWSPS